MVYAIVLEHDTQSMVSAQAEQKATQIVAQADTHMALEKQAIGETLRRFEIDRIKKELLEKMPGDLWDDA